MFENKSILIDSCIINNLLSKEKNLAKETNHLFSSLIEADNKLYISEYTHYEVLRGATEPKKKKAEEYLGYFINIETTKERLERATKLYTAYGNNVRVKSILHSISDVDIFIGSLIFTDHQPLLLTADYSDFPRPFFSEEHCERIEYKTKKGNKNALFYYFLKANLDTIL